MGRPRKNPNDAFYDDMMRVCIKYENALERSNQFWLMMRFICKGFVRKDLNKNELITSLKVAVEIVMEEVWKEEKGVAEILTLNENTHKE